MKLALERDCDAEGAMLLSRSWLQNWKVRQCKVPHLQNAAVSPTQAITCVHGLLLPKPVGRCAPASSSLLAVRKRGVG